MKAMLEPLPFVPATWITGGRCSCGAPKARSSRSRRPERQVDLLRMQVEQAFEDQIRLLVRTPRRAASSCGLPVRMRDDGSAGRRAAPSGAHVLAAHDHVTMPWTWRYSARWKPSGRRSRIVCSITRAPAKPMTAPGSAIEYRPLTPRIGGGDAAGRRVGEHDDIGAASPRAGAARRRSCAAFASTRTCPPASARRPRR